MNRKPNKRKEIETISALLKDLIKNGIEIKLRAILFRCLSGGPWGPGISRVRRTARFVWLKKFQKKRSSNQQQTINN